MEKCLVVRVGVFLALLMTVTSCGSDSGESTPKVIDEDTGSFEGITIGHEIPGDLNEILGERCDRVADLTPCDVFAITGPHSVRGEWKFENHSTVTVLTHGGNVQALVIADEDAETSRGVAIGDDLSVAKSEYQGLQCTVQVFQESTGNPYCERELPQGNKILFGGDPIDSIVVGRGFG